MESVETTPQKLRGSPLIHAYLSKLDNEAKLSAKTILSRKSFLNKFVLDCIYISELGPYQIDEILLSVDRQFVKRYTNKLLYDRKINKKSFKTTLSAIRRFYDWLVETHRIKENPLALLRPRTKPRIKKVRPPLVTLEQLFIQHPLDDFLIEAIKLWLAHIAQFTKATQRHYRSVFRDFYKTLPLHTKQIVCEHIERFILNYKGINSTKNTHLVVIRSFCKYLETCYDLPNPCKKIKKLKEEPPKRIWLTDKQVAQVLAVCDERESKVIRLIMHTGLRAEEVRSLQLENISPDHKSVVFIGKGRKERRVPLNDTARASLVQNGKVNLDFLKGLKALHRNSVYALCKIVSKRAGLNFVASPHAFRRYFANSLKKRGISIYYISKLLGHSTIKTTEMYLSCSPEELQGLTDILCDAQTDGRGDRL